MCRFIVSYRLHRCLTKLGLVRLYDFKLLLCCYSRVFDLNISKDQKKSIGHTTRYHYSAFIGSNLTLRMAVSDGPISFLAIKMIHLSTYMY